MKYGKQLLVGQYGPWQSKYVRYAKLKRLITRFELEIGLEGKRNRASSAVELPTVGRVGSPTYGASPTYGVSPVNGAAGIKQQYDEQSSLLHLQGTPGSATPVTNYGGEARPQEARRRAFFEIINEDLQTINSFFVGKEAELERTVQVGALVLNMQDLEKASLHPYLMEWKGDMTHFRKVYAEVVELLKFQELNKEGLRKIVKKYDKVTKSEEMDPFMAKLQEEYFVTSNRPSHLKEHMERLLSRDKLIKLHADMEEEETDAIFPQVKHMRLLVAVGLGACILSSDLLLHVSPFAHRCLALLAFTVAMWALEAIPYFATALLVPILVVVFQVLEDPKNPGHPLPAEAAANAVLSSLCNHTTILVLGGYTVSAALSRCEIELQIADAMQKAFGHRPKLFMLALMYLGLFLSAVISNHTAPVLCLSILTPVIRDFPPDSAYTRCLLLGLAFACNFGGMMTPISSMQDALAVAYLNNVHVEVSFGRWIGVAVPLCVLLTTLCWAYLLAVYQPTDVTSIPPIVRSKESLNRRDWVVLSLSMVTILLWSTLEFTRPYLGDLGIVSLLFIVTMFGSGMLTQVDFNSFSWHTLFLLGGGSVLGKAVTSSRLLDYLADVIFAALPTDNFPLLLAEILTFVLLISTFISHTVAALIIMPLVVELGVHVGDPTGVGVTSAFAISAAMALPFSSFPNVLLVSTTDDLDQPYLKTKDFFVTGLPISIMALVGVGTVGYFLIQVFM